ncbi:TetR/AcrR family transcriptional regulator [Enterorhabdus sp. P55]|uniref:TetR/AcrR family transcriptional regulator n=1 Tax=Enterorhabdus sp. P55 TaxID=2304571 RepID=UPI0013695585|nr:TetR/AcrR family transcriptional regulator [Enterorhabdus sp. P55]NBI33161.1 TetR family transcriptional regulator [Enterorhabdus sp. P55]
MAASDENAPKLDRRVVRTRKAIQAAFRNLVVRQGAEKITVSALAREADIDRKTFYLHYASLDELAEEQGHLVVDRITQVLVVGREPDGITVNLRTVVTELAAMFQEDPEFYRRVARELSVDSMVEALCEPVRQAIVESNPPAAELDQPGLDYLIRFFLAGTLAVFVHWFLNEPDTPIGAVVDHVQRTTGDSHLFHLTS